MSKRVIIIHCWGGSPDYAWYPWLKNGLEGRGYDVLVPEMPSADEPRISNWIPEIEKIVGEVDENTYFVGHSIGVQAIVRVLERMPEGQKAGGAVFVAGFFKHLTGMGDDPTDLDVMKEWLETPVDLNKVKAHINKSVAIFSESDPFVPLDNQEDFKDELGSEIITLPGPGHFSGGDDNCIELPEVLQALEQMM